MRAVVLDSFETPTFRLTTLPRPEAGAGQVLVKVAASGVNPIDYKIRQGRAVYALPALPAVLGTDLAGTVEAVGLGVTRFKVGDAVYGLTGGVKGLPGSLAEYAAVDADLLALKPRTIDMRAAAALPLVALTAWEGLVDRANVRRGQTVLVLGAAGGVGHIAAQIAVARGATVFGTASSTKQHIVQAFGATPIDYSTEDTAAYVARLTGGEGFEIVYDAVGGASLDNAFVAAAPYGYVVSCSAFGTHPLAPASLHCLTISGVFVLLPMLSGKRRARHGAILEELANLVDDGTVAPVLDPRHFTLETAQEAHAAVEGGTARIKIVIDVAP